MKKIIFSLILSFGFFVVFISVSHASAISDLSNSVKNYLSSGDVRNAHGAALDAILDDAVISEGAGDMEAVDLQMKIARALVNTGCVDASLSGELAGPISATACPDLDNQLNQTGY